MGIQEALAQSAEELRKRVTSHQRLLNEAIESDEGTAKLNECLFVECPHKLKLNKTLVEVINTLEETRKAFKSKKLEVLRKKLIRVLTEDA